MRSLLLTLLLILPLPAGAQLTLELNDLSRTQVRYVVDKSGEVQPGLRPENPVLERRPGISLTDQLDALRQTLVNLPTFTNATWELDTAGGDTLIRWTFEESRTVFPLFNFGGVRGNSYYQIGFSDIHFRGRGQRLTAFYQNNDGEHNYFLSLTNPSWRGGRWGYQLESRRYAAVEPVYFDEGTVNYRYANLSFGLGGSYSPRPREQLTFGVSTFNERYVKTEDAAPGAPGPDRVNQQKLLFKAGRTRDRRDHFAERTGGHHHETTAQAVLTFGEQQPFFIAWHDFRYYRLLGRRGNLAARLRAGLSSNGNTPFAPFVLDSQVNIRGSGNRIDRGTAQLILNLEYRYSVWRDRRARFAVQFVAFSDLGTWRNPGGELADLAATDNIRHFVGGGVRLLSLKAHNAVLRLDYGVDRRNKNERGFVVGFGQYF